MDLRALIRAAAVLGVLLLPLVCLCQVVPGQRMNGPYLLLVPRSHSAAPAAVALSDDELADLAFASGQAVSVTDEGAVDFGYAEDAGTAAGVSGLDFQRQGAPLEQNPTLDGLVPLDPPGAPAAPARPLRLRLPVGGAQFQPAPPERPPLLA